MLACAGLRPPAPRPATSTAAAAAVDVRLVLSLSCHSLATARRRLSPAGLVSGVRFGHNLRGGCSVTSSLGDHGSQEPSSPGGVDVDATLGQQTSPLAASEKRQFQGGAGGGPTASAPSESKALRAVTLWVKRMDVAEAQYVEVENVDLRQTVSKFKARWMAEEELHVRLSLVMLRLVGCGSPMPTAAKEKEAAVLDDPSRSLAESGVMGKAWLLAYVTGTPRFAFGQLPARRRRLARLDILRIRRRTAGTVSTAANVSPQVTPVDLEAFWQQLSHATVDGDVLRLASGTTFLGSGLPNSSSMYIRADYVGMWSEIQRLFTDKNFTRIVISGNPGIGKSFLGLWIAFKILSDGLRRMGDPVTIVWEECLSGTRTLIRDGRVLAGSLQDFSIELSDKNTWYLVDECVFPGPWRVKARTIVFSSPMRDNYRLLLKTAASTIRYLGLWSWKEIDDCRKLLYANDPVRTPDAVEKAFARWAGIPRFVLEKVGDASAQSELDKAFLGCNVSTIWKSVGAIDSAPDASHRLLQIIPSASYELSHVDFASDYIASRVTELFLTEQRNDLISFVSRDSGSLLASMRGLFFEFFAHEKLAAGGKFRKREMGLAAKESTIKLIPKQVHRFPGNEPKDFALLSTGTLASRSYFQPLNRNYPVMDAIVLPNTLYQMTVSLEHDVKESKLEEMVGILNLKGGEKIDLVFVVPPDKYDKFKPYKFRDKMLGQRVTQSALCVPFDIVVTSPNTTKALPPFASRKKKARKLKAAPVAETKPDADDSDSVTVSEPGIE